VLITKVDLLAGFNEYFARLSNDERAQVWGFTVPLAQSDSARADVAASFRTEFSLLQKRIEEALPDVLQGEPDVQRRGSPTRSRRSSPDCATRSTASSRRSSASRSSRPRRSCAACT
jgi:hypothetical protein